jgi:hypothetical protein
MEINYPYVGDVGTKIQVDVGVDVSDIVSAKLIVKKPDNTIVEWIATPDTDTYVYYIVQDGDFNLAGKYYLQAYIKTNNWSGYGSITSFYVKERLS